MMADEPTCFAHSANAAGALHLLGDHLRTTADRARQLAASFGAGDLGYWAGLWHDLGKFAPEWQQYLAAPNRQRSPGHSLAGAALASQTLEFVSLLIAGHHAGLPSHADLKARLRDATSSLLSEVRTRAGDLVPATSVDAAATIPSFATADRLGAELLLRMVFSALVDADFMDTEAHFSPAEVGRRGGYPAVSELWDRFHEDQARLTGRTDADLARARHELYESCLWAAGLPQGVFSLTVPTGGGKTRSAMGFALRHTLTHGLERIIVAIPYTSIIEQTAAVYRGIFGDAAVVEHHSQALRRDTTEEEGEATLRALLASENWDAPIIVTTTVQLFESLFSNRPAACRKVHNLARSVIILDEIQTLPVKLLEPILDALQQLADHYGTTVVLSTATQPALHDGPFEHQLRGVREIVPEAARYFERLKRVEYELHVDFPWGWERVAEEMMSSPACLAVVNTKSDAIHLLAVLDDPEALHLSTLLCGAHRRDVLSEIRARLAGGQPCRVVSTQVVEAGVDLDFPLVLRAVGPLDRIVQAAGRCNREGKLTVGRVVVFYPLDGRTPRGEYRTGTDTAAALLSSRDADLHDPSLYHTYFQRLYQATTLDGKGIQPLRRRLDYPEVAALFRLIEDDSVSLVVRYRPEATDVDRLVAMIRSSAAPDGSLRYVLRQLQPYLVNVRARQLTEYERTGLAVPLMPDAGLWEWRGWYDSRCGLASPDIDPETLVI